MYKALAVLEQIYECVFLRHLRRCGGSQQLSEDPTSTELTTGKYMNNVNNVFSYPEGEHKVNTI